jgi:hypothetical protein
MTETLSPLPVQAFLNNNGQPLVGGLLYTYAAGTNTPLATYTSSSGLTPNTNPIVLDYRGSCQIWIPPNTAYKYILNDSFGNLIWSVDQIINAQLITLYGGVDSGVVNAYVLNYAAPFTSLTNGIVAYWVPATTNTGPSTVNVNSFGVFPLVNPNGSALSAGQVTTGQPLQMMYYNGNWILLNGTFISGLLVAAGGIQVGSTGAEPMTGYGATAGAQVDFSPDSGSFTGTFTGFTVSQTGTVYWYRVGKSCTMTLPNISGTANATTFTMTGYPSELTPVNALDAYYSLPLVKDASTLVTTGFSVSVQGSGTLVFAIGGSNSGWTASGTRELYLSGFTFSLL